MDSIKTTGTLAEAICGTLQRPETKTTSQNSRSWQPSDQWRAVHLGFDETFHPKSKLLATNSEWFAKAYLENDRSHGDSLLIAGNTGCGKTHAARRIWSYVLARQISAWSAGKFGAVDHIGAPAFIRWDSVAEVSEAEWNDVIAGEVKPSRFVVLDDIGADTDRFKSGVPARRLKEVLDAAEGKWLLVTTNIERGKLKDHFGQRVADRLARCRFLGLFEVPSYRQTKVSAAC